jgi:hypothetical protein
MAKLSYKDQTDLMQLNALVDSYTALDVFKPNYGGGELLLRSKKHQILFLGGNKCGKTFQCLAKLGLRTVPELADGKKTGWFKDPYVRRRIPNRKLEAWISCYSQPVQKETIQPAFDTIFKPYIKNIFSESGIYKDVELEFANIHFKWQEASKRSYEGANVDLIMWDEPHDQSIYNEMLSRFAKTQGYIWGGATLVINPDDPDAVKKLQFIEWMYKNLIQPWEENPDSRPELDIIYANIRENEHVDANFQISMWAGLSEAEQLVRETGRYYRIVGQSIFNRQMLVYIEDYLRKHPEESEPEYGVLEYVENDGDLGVKFNQTRNNFPERPQGEFIVKIWERPISDKRLLRPQYFIGCDVAEGVTGGDYTSAYVRRADTNRVVAALHGHLSELELAKQLNMLGLYYCDNNGAPAILAIEVNNYGKTTQQYLITGHRELGIYKYGLHRIYHRPLNEDIERGMMIMGKEPGWKTSPRNRDFLLTAMRMALVEAYAAIKHGGPCTITDIGWINEAMNFIRDKNDKFNAIKGVSNDDRLFSLAITDKCKEQYYRTKIVTVKQAVNDDIWLADDGGIILNIEAARRQSREYNRKRERMVY